MEVDIKKIDQDVLSVLKEVGREAAKQKVSAYIVGGCVRDLILKRKSLDFDVVVQGNAIALARSLAKRKSVSLKVYQRFGTATLTYKDGICIDLATARKEVYPHPGALPVVSFGNMQEDLFRRDFTINAIAVRIGADGFGEWFDPYGGLEDIRKGKIRVLHEKSFKDDPTRILRAVRFEQRLGFCMGRKALALLKQALKKGGARTVKAPRYFAEFEKVLKEENPVAAIRRLNQLEGLKFLRGSQGPSMALMNRVQRFRVSQQKKDLFCNQDWPSIYLMGLLSGKSRTFVQKMSKEFQWTRVRTKKIQESLAAPEIVKELQQRGLTPSNVYRLLHPLSVDTICFVCAMAISRQVSHYVQGYLTRTCHVKLIITGATLKQETGVSGLHIGKIMEALLLKKMDGKVKTLREEKKEAQRMAVALK